MDSCKIKINEKEYEVQKGMSVIEACEKYADIKIPRFCYHDKLKVAGNCRMCLVEIKPGPPKPSASCSTKVTENMEIFTNSPMVTKAREDVMMFMLANHPLDCPVCDQGGECDLQDQAYVYGKTCSNFSHEKRSVEDKDFGPFIKTKMNRCIHCTRCIRFAEDIAGTVEIGLLNRGNGAEITTLESSISSELSGNLVDLCPVGALTNATYKARARPWELKKTKTVDVFDAIGSSIEIHSKDNEILRIVPSENNEINELWISDKSRHAFDSLYLQRIDNVYQKSENLLKIVENTDKATAQVAEVIKNSKKIGIISGGMTNMQTLYIAKQIADLHSNSQYSCFEKDLNFNTKSLTNTTFNSKISGIDEADFFLIVGCNPRKDSPVLNARIRKNVVNKKSAVFCINETLDLTYNAEFLPANSDSIDLQNNEKLMKSLKNSQKPMMIVGEDVFFGKNGLILHNKTMEIAEKFGFATKDWNGYNILHKNIANVGGIALGFTTGNSQSIIDSVKSGKTDCLILINTDEINTNELPDSCKIISFSSHGSQNLQNCDFIFPALTYAEQDSYFMNIEGRFLSTTGSVEIVDQELNEINVLCKILHNITGEFITNKDDIDKILRDKFGDFDSISSNKVNLEYTKPQISEILPISAKDYNFYMSDLLSKNSANMAKKCSYDKNKT